MACPICKKPTLAAVRPFCSKRCADIDLGKWFSGSYAIPADDPEDADDLESQLQQSNLHKPH